MQYQFPYRYRVLVLLFFLTLITYLDRVCISVVGVRIKSEFHLTNEQFGWVLGAFSLAYALFEIPSGMLGDRIGQRAVFIRIVLWWSLFTVFTGFTTGLASLIERRVAEFGGKLEWESPVRIQPVPQSYHAGFRSRKQEEACPLYS